MYKFCICKVTNYVLKNPDPHKGHHGESALTIHRIPDSQKGHHQISTAGLPANKQSNFIIVYRVSIKSFPDYRHLLQENYVEYKHIFLPLLKLVSKILCHVLIVKFVTFDFWMQHFQTGGLGETVRYPGHHDRQISPPLTSFKGVC